MKFLIAQVRLRKQTKIFQRLDQILFIKNKGIAKMQKKVCGFICVPKVILLLTIPFIPLSVLLSDGISIHGIKQEAIKISADAIPIC
jgi:hypothetical protein